MSTSGALAGEEESDEESSSSSANVLEEFRNNWQKELQQTHHLSSALGNLSLANDSEESMAQRLFLQGTEYERMGKVFDAIRHYRRAVQLVPDIELRVRPLLAQQEEDEATEVANIDETEEIPEEADDKEDLSNVDLTLRFQGALGRCGKVCERPSDEKVLQTSLHISDLPTEIILYIFKWVVSRDLDVRSLEYLGLVCRGFYILARDPEIWRLACTKVWRSSVGLSPKALGYSTWRQMFQERYRVNFHGCYISKTSYLRYGENSFQDQFYRPVHLIEYYRYMRFFPEGRVLMLTTPDEPVNCVGKLKDRFPQKKEVLVGKYEIHEDILMILLKKSEQRRQKLPRETKRQQNSG
uniref:Uncharacterized protein n=1 Tax=Phlebotomus papatasi TaxID=29031 RepID=A0A1B0DQF6_PHLPP